eukprot:m.192563 g.192563  ORF g.192563 m.192563 type:complete len:487 (-) comp32473_c0_seq1:39-1499(-)
MFNLNTAYIALVCLVFQPVCALNNGLALTPPMGWSTWYAFGSEINETKIIQMADMMVSTGLRDAGYEFVNLDDAWMSPMRDRFGNLQGDADRFPSGMKWLAEQMHMRGLKLGLYGCVGVRTCEGFPGQFEHEYQDAATIASWGVDWWKHDNCWQKWATVEMYSGALGNHSFPNTGPAIQNLLNGLEYSLNIRGLSTEGQDAHPINWNNISGLPLATPDDDANGGYVFSPRGHQIQQYEAFRLFGEALQATGRNITYSICPLIAGCDPSIWTYYKDHAHMSMNQCIQVDNTDTWASFLYHIDDNNRFPRRAEAAGPGYWNDIDFLMVGYKQLKAWEPRQSNTEYRSQYTLFAILAAPMIFSADIRGTAPYNHWNKNISSILLNTEVIAVSQDVLGKQGKLVKQLTDTLQLYVRQLHGGAVAVAALNRGAEKVTNVSITWADVRKPDEKKITSVKDLWTGTSVPFTPDGFMISALESHETVLLRLDVE